MGVTNRQFIAGTNPEFEMAAAAAIKRNHQKFFFRVHASIEGHTHTW